MEEWPKKIVYDKIRYLFDRRRQFFSSRICVVGRDHKQNFLPPDDRLWSRCLGPRRKLHIHCRTNTKSCQSSLGYILWSSSCLIQKLAENNLVRVMQEQKGNMTLNPTILQTYFKVLIVQYDKKYSTTWYDVFSLKIILNKIIH